MEEKPVHIQFIMKKKKLIGCKERTCGGLISTLVLIFCLYCSGTSAQIISLPKDSISQSTKQKTSSGMEDEQYLIRMDTVVMELVNDTFFIPSAENVNQHHKRIGFKLPENTIAWAYYIGTLPEAGKGFEDAAYFLNQVKKTESTAITDPLTALLMKQKHGLKRIQEQNELGFYIANYHNFNQTGVSHSLNILYEGKGPIAFARIMKPDNLMMHINLVNTNKLSSINAIVKVKALFLEPKYGTKK